jgi:hypothetical protein
MTTKTKFFSIIIAVLLAVIVAQRIFTPAPECPQNIELRVDTVYHTVTKTQTKYVKITKIDSSYHPVDTMYLVDTNCEVTKSRFLKLVKQHVIRNIYADSIRIDTIGYVKIYDTVQFNKLSHRGYMYTYKIPTITIEKVKPILPTRQMYIGGGLDGTYINRTPMINIAKVGVLYKTKKDQIYGASVGVSINGYLVYGLQSYWKIKLK